MRSKTGFFALKPRSPLPTLHKDVFGLAVGVSQDEQQAPFPGRETQVDDVSRARSGTAWLARPAAYGEDTGQAVRTLDAAVAPTLPAAPGDVGRRP